MGLIENQIWLKFLRLMFDRHFRRSPLERSKAREIRETSLPHLRNLSCSQAVKRGAEEMDDSGHIQDQERRAEKERRKSWDSDFEGPERRSGLDRRGRKDRRGSSERRSGGDRRSGEDRREEELETATVPKFSRPKRLPHRLVS